MFDFVSLPSVLPCNLLCISAPKLCLNLIFRFCFGSFLENFLFKMMKMRQLRRHSLHRETSTARDRHSKRMKLELFTQTTFAHNIFSVYLFICGIFVFFFYFYSTWRTFVQRTQYIVYTLRRESEREDRN